VYGPVNVVYALLGTVTSGFAWAFTGGRTDIAREIITASVRGDYVVTPENLTFSEPLVFTGRQGPLDEPREADETSDQWQ
jgi:hypothetical protein